jgi:hypothetical protein
VDAEKRVKSRQILIYSIMTKKLESFKNEKFEVNKKELQFLKGGTNCTTAKTTYEKTINRDEKAVTTTCNCDTCPPNG